MPQRILVLLVLLCVSHVQAGWLVGVGKKDMTGPSVGLGFMGYGEASQRGTGIHDRLWARAFIVADSDSGDRVVIVSISCAMIYGDVTREVVERLQAMFGSRYQEGNLLIVADHSHSGNGGQGGHLLFNLAVPYNADAFEAMVSGIVEAVEQAHNHLAPGRVLVNKGELFNASANRSLTAFLRNPEAASMPSVDPEMLVLRFEQAGRPVGMLGWFATHGVSFPMESTLISGDNKAYAAQLMETSVGGDFVAAFPQTNAGDMTPNLFLNGTGPGTTPEQSARIIGERQFRVGLQLFLEANEELSGSLKWQHEYVDFSTASLPERLTGVSDLVATCPAAVGYGFGAGTADGRPRPWRFFFKENQRHAYWPFTWATWSTGLTVEMEACQYPKPVLLALGASHDFNYLASFVEYMTGGSNPGEIANRTWAPHILPVSIVQLGSLGLLGVPAEFTIVSGLRLKNTVRQITGEALPHLVVAGYANDYSLYVTTPEEYQEQRYEGGATLFGQWTLPAYQQAFERLAHNLIKPESIKIPRVWPDDLRGYYQSVEEQDIACPGTYAQHGALETSVPEMLWTGQNVTACFTSSHPNLAVRKLSTFLTVEKLQEDGRWQVMATDDSWDTRFHWNNRWFGNTAGRACIEWHIPAAMNEGVYRLGHHGLWRDGRGRLIPYHGYSQRMSVVQQLPAGILLTQTRKTLSALNN